MSIKLQQPVQAHTLNRIEKYCGNTPHGVIICAEYSAIVDLRRCDTSIQKLGLLNLGTVYLETSRHSLSTANTLADLH